MPGKSRTGRGVLVRRTDEAALAQEENTPVIDNYEIEKELTKEFSAEYEFTDVDTDADIRSFYSPRRKPIYEDAFDEYQALWSEIALRRDRIEIIDKIVSRIVARKDLYRAVETETGVPWYVVAVIHSLEASLNFKSHLHNGDPLTDRTKQVPAGRPVNGQPPFTWIESAKDALTYDGFSKNKDWSIERIAYLLEEFNGWGYRLHHREVKSPYLWSFTNHYIKGKYVADGKWSPTAVSGQCGAMALLKRLDESGAIRITRGSVSNFAAAQSEENPSSNYHFNYMEDDGDIDPSVISPAEFPTDDEIKLTDFGIDGKGDFPLDDPGLYIPSRLTAFTTDFDIEKTLNFLRECQNSRPRVRYGYGDKIRPGERPGRDFVKVDCSGFVRELVRLSTNLGSKFPDGSQVQHDWVRKKGFPPATIESGNSVDGAVRIAFLPKAASPSGIGHVALLYNGRTIESHGGVGPDTLPWRSRGWRRSAVVYLLGR